MEDAKILAETLAGVDSKIVDELRELVPKGPNCLTMCEILREFKWDYAIVLFHEIERIEKSLDGSLGNGATDFYYRSLLNDYKHPCCNTGLFDNMRVFLPEPIANCSTVKLKKDVVIGMRDALMEDVLSFTSKETFPVYYHNFEEWKQYQAYNLLKIMDTHRVDSYEMVKSCFKRWNASGFSYKKGANHPLKQDPMYQSTANFMTLLERIQLLENRIRNLETETK